MYSMFRGGREENLEGIWLGAIPPVVCFPAMGCPSDLFKIPLWSLLREKKGQIKSLQTNFPCQRQMVQSVPALRCKALQGVGCAVLLCEWLEPTCLCKAVTAFSGGMRHHVSRNLFYYAVAIITSSVTVELFHPDLACFVSVPLSPQDTPPTHTHTISHSRHTT